MPFSGCMGSTRKQREFAIREQQILEAALSLFEGPHWEQVTVEQIAKKANIGKGTVYKHFTCKEEIYGHITIDFTKRLFEDFIEAVENKEVLDCLKEIIRIAFDLYLNNPAEARVSFYCKRDDYRERLNKDMQKLFDELDEQFETFVGSILQRGIDQGMFPNKPVEQLMMGLEATFDGAISMIWNNNLNRAYEADQATYVDVISEYMLAGLVGLKTS